MKKIITIMMTCLGIFCLIPSQGNAQASCIQYPNKPKITQVGPGMYMVEIIDYFNPTQGVKTFNVTVTATSGEVCFSECVEVRNGQTSSYDTVFACASTGFPTLTVISYTGNAQQACSGAPCFEFTTLPVNLTSFSATRNNASVLLTWETGMELNNTGFAVERNTIGGWEEIAFIPTRAVGGNSDANLRYSYSDQNSHKGITQYRLRQVDLDGRQKFSVIRAVRGKDQTSVTTVFPTPTTDGKVKVFFEDASAFRTATLIDMTGRVLKQWTSTGDNLLQIEGLSPGSYVLRIVSDDGVPSMQKIIAQ